VRLLPIVLAMMPAIALAEPSLRVTHEPPPRHLRMRPRAPVAQRPAPSTPAAGATTKPTPIPAPPTVSATSPERNDVDDIEGVRNVRQRVSVSFNLGYQVDGARPSGYASLGAKAPTAGTDYSALRSYGFGEGFLSTRGLFFDSLSTYFALRFQAAGKLPTGTSPLTGDERAIPPPIATWFERSGGEVRTGWAEVANFLPPETHLQPIRVRAGDQFVYGPWIVHMDGLYATYETTLITAALYGGFRHSDYTRDQGDARPGIAGASLRFDLRGLTDKVPIAIIGEALQLTASDETGQDANQAAKLEVDWRPRRDVAVIGEIRSVNREVANQHAEVRVRYKQVTNFVFDVMRRFSADWRWDPSLVTFPMNDPTEPRRYLDLGAVLPQLIASVRAGTLIADNIDLFGRAALARDLSEDNAQKNTFSAPYAELGGALEVRLRRQVAFGASILSRQTDRPELGFEIPDDHRSPQPLPPKEDLGEAGFTEVGLSVRLSLGARKFSSLVEVYGRRTRFTPLYSDGQLPVTDSDFRGGGRINIDAWVGPRVRLFASYDISSELGTAPEVTGYKSLKLIVSGVY
jgi:hypothetical protein